MDWFWFMVSHEAVVKMSREIMSSEGLSWEVGATSKMVHSRPLTGSLSSSMVMAGMLQILAMWASP